jgi:hypothetical protein
MADPDKKRLLLAKTLASVKRMCGWLEGGFKNILTILGKPGNLSKSTEALKPKSAEEVGEVETEAAYVSEFSTTPTIRQIEKYAAIKAASGGKGSNKGRRKKGNHKSFVSQSSYIGVYVRPPETRRPYKGTAE